MHDNAWMSLHDFHVHHVGNLFRLNRLRVNKPNQNGDDAEQVRAQK